MRHASFAAIATAVTLLLGCADGTPTGPIAMPSSSAAAGVSGVGWLPGLTAPDLTAYDALDAEVALSDLAGSFVLLEVGAVWCAPSRQLAPLLSGMRDAIRDDGVDFETVTVLVQGFDPSQWSRRTHVEAWLDTYYHGNYDAVFHVGGSEEVGMQWLHATGPNGWLPTLILLGPDRQVLDVRAGGDAEATLLAWLRERIGEHLDPAPRIAAVAPPPEVLWVGTPLVITGTYVNGEPATVTGEIDWGDGHTDALVIGPDGALHSPAHEYADVGFFAIRVTISDVKGRSDSQSLPLLAVVDPDAGFVVANGSVTSPASACRAPTICGDSDNAARLQLLARYERRSTAPAGTFRFRFESGEFTFESTSYDWLVVNRADTNVQLRGVGAIAGFVPETYGLSPDAVTRFMIWATDGRPDTVRLQIWIDDPYTGESYPLYLGEEALPLLTGNIMVHAR